MKQSGRDGYYPREAKHQKCAGLTGGEMMGIFFFLAALSASGSLASPARSYTEDYPLGSPVVFTQGVWDCGRIDEIQAIATMKKMAFNPGAQVSFASNVGCKRTISFDKVDSPWHVVRHIATLCEQREVHGTEIFLPNGKTETRFYEGCGIEAHALLVERNGVQRTAIDIIDMQSYD